MVSTSKSLSEKQPTRVQNLILYGWPPSNGRAASATVTDAKGKKIRAEKASGFTASSNS